MDPAKLTEQLETMDTVTVFGEYKVKEDQPYRGLQLKKTVPTCQWQKEKLEVVWPKEAATADLAPFVPWEER